MLNHEGPGSAWAVLTESKNPTKPSPVVLTGAKRSPGQLKWSKNASCSFKCQRILLILCVSYFGLLFTLSGFKRFFFFGNGKDPTIIAYAFTGFLCNNMVF